MSLTGYECPSDQNRDPSRQSEWGFGFELANKELPYRCVVIVHNANLLHFEIVPNQKVIKRFRVLTRADKYLLVMGPELNGVFLQV